MDFFKLAQKYNDRVVAIRHDIHMHPELSHEEFRTSAIVAKTLGELEGVEVLTGIGGTGVVGIIRGKGPGRTIALRADMDALPIQEEVDIPFKSTVPGVMHACGHDVHTSILLGTAMVLSELRDQFNGTVKLLFQPAEEKSPEGGARGMMEDGALENPKPEGIIGLHILPFIESGLISLKEGDLLAAADQFEIKITGTACHAASPHLGTDAIACGAALVTALQNVVSRMTDPMEPAVVSVGTLVAGDRDNVIAKSAVLNGTCRTFNAATRAHIKEKIRQVTKGICDAFGATAEVTFIDGYPPLYSDPKLTRFCKGVAESLFGPEGVVIKPKPAMGGEDFAFYTEVMPGAFISLGTGTAGQKNAPLHSPHMYVREDSFPYGISFMSKCAIDFLSQPADE